MFCCIWFSLVLCVPSVLWHCWLGHLTRKNPSPIWPIMCLVGLNQSINRARRLSSKRFHHLWQMSSVLDAWTLFITFVEICFFLTEKPGRSSWPDAGLGSADIQDFCAASTEERVQPHTVADHHSSSEQLLMQGLNYKFIWGVSSHHFSSFPFVSLPSPS